MAAHSSILAWRIPWTEEPDSPWNCKVWHDWVANTFPSQVEFAESLPSGAFRNSTLQYWGMLLTGSVLLEAHCSRQPEKVPGDISDHWAQAVIDWAPSAVGKPWSWGSWDASETVWTPGPGTGEAAYISEAYWKSPSESAGKIPFPAVKC